MFATRYLLQLIKFQSSIKDIRDQSWKSSIGSSWEVQTKNKYFEKRPTFLQKSSCFFNFLFFIILNSYMFFLNYVRKISCKVVIPSLKNLVGDRFLMM